MIVHYLKIAFRNMWKYKSRTLISLFGLAVGFTCFAMATLWIRYEMTFDSFHKNAGQMYVVYKPSTFSPTGYSRTTVYPLASYLKESFPEIVNATTLIPASRSGKIKVDDVEYAALTMSVDSSFFSMFDVKILEGSQDFLINDSKYLAITREKARQLFGDEHPIGKTVNLRNEDFTICAVVSEMSQRSNYAFELLRSFRPYAMIPITNWRGSSGENTIIELLRGTNIEAFEKKLFEHEPDEEKADNRKLMIKPITKIRYTDTNIVREVKFQYIVIFSLAGLLVVLCSLFNYLTLFVSRFRIRQKELAIRMVYGASGRSLMAMLTVEFMLTLLFTVLLGYLMTQMFLQSFLILSEIQMNILAIYREALLYIGGVILVSLLVFRLILFIFRRRSLNLSIRRTHKQVFRKMSIGFQLLISIGFVFCTLVMLKQLFFLHHTNELGFSFQNRGVIEMREEGLGGVLANQLKQIPEIIEVVDAKGMNNLVPLSSRMSHRIDSWDDKPADTENINLERLYVSPEYNTFYQFRLVVGEMLTDSDPDSLVLLNESAVKAFGWHDPVGKNFTSLTGNYTVKGVIKNVYNFAPTILAQPVCYSKPGDLMWAGSTLVLFEYKEGLWKPCKEKIDRLIQTEYANSDKITVFNSEEEYNKFLKSENALLKLLSVVSAICVLVCVFGFVSLVSLTCEERRKSIAIRKINGATSVNILAMFSKEYSLLLIIGAAIAFSAGFIIIQRWLENYVKQTNIPVWVYLSILFVMALVIACCVGWQVYKTSVESPAVTIKNNG